MTEYGFEPIRKIWLDHAARLGSVVTARTSQDTLSGVFETVDPDGNMILNAEGTRHVIPAADVYF